MLPGVWIQVRSTRDTHGVDCRKDLVFHGTQAVDCKYTQYFEVFSVSTTINSQRSGVHTQHWTVTCIGRSCSLCHVSFRFIPFVSFLHDLHTESHVVGPATPYIPLNRFYILAWHFSCLRFLFSFYFLVFIFSPAFSLYLVCFSRFFSIFLLSRGSFESVFVQLPCIYVYLATTAGFVVDQSWYDKQSVNHLEYPVRQGM